MQRDKSGENNPNYKHGFRNTAFYRSWADMKKRCSNPLSASYENYGGRGITYDSKWESFINFKNDMFDSYISNLTLERVDVNVGYTKENCKWVPKDAQSRNQRKRKDNNSGVVGVYFLSKYNRRVNKFYPAWVAVWSDNSVQKSKSFSINKYGSEAAYNMACEYRKKQLTCLEDRGVLYGDNHWH